MPPRTNSSNNTAPSLFLPLQLHNQAATTLGAQQAKNKPHPSSHHAQVAYTHLTLHSERTSESQSITADQMAIFWLQYVLKHGKFDYSAFNTPQDTLNATKSLAINRPRMLTPNSHQQHFLVDDSRFGLFLGEQFTEMLAENETLRVAQVESTQHAAAMALKIKETPEGKKLSVNVYDPLVSGTHVSSQSTSTEGVLNHRLSSYFNVLNREFNNQTALIIIHRNEANNPDTRFTTADSDHIDMACIKYCNTKDLPSIIFYAIEQNYPSLLNFVRNQFGFNFLPFIELLNTKRIDESPTMTRAAYYNCAEVLEALIKILSALPPKYSKPAAGQLLLAKKPSGETPHTIALMHGHDKTMRTMSKLIDLIDEQEKPRILEEIVTNRLANGNPPVLVAIQNSKVDSLRAWIELFEKLPVAARKRAIIAITLATFGVNSGGPIGMYILPHALKVANGQTRKLFLDLVCGTLGDDNAKKLVRMTIEKNVEYTAQS